ncbi:5'/3'-nucleotidase SurE [Halomarina litorea]|uniref:5'/3'-nucleotidase SurE n=1 Tax=Halomarina litorea TaxID=2961595 RepID=UPI0020C20AB1|nr:5'/3'-nucleotidase SurE [Halomarina sp. BCD28]
MNLVPNGFVLAGVTAAHERRRRQAGRERRGERVNVLLTNDDGIDAPGLRALASALGELGDVTVVAPATNQSAVGRGLSYGRMGPDVSRAGGDFGLSADEEFTVTIPHEEHELGYAVHGTPCDCVILGAGAFERPDVVVAGCNPGANLGVHVLPRSGTASAATEAASLGVPGVAVSMDTLGMTGERAPEDFERACDVATSVVSRAIEGDAFETVDYLNVNVPRPDRPLDGVSVTRPTPVYEMDAKFEDGRFRLHNPLWAQMAAESLPDPSGTDRRAIAADRVSISPLTLPGGDPDDETLSGFADLFEGVVESR